MAIIEAGTTPKRSAAFMADLHAEVLANGQIPRVYRIEEYREGFAHIDEHPQVVAIFIAGDLINRRGDVVKNAEAIGDVLAPISRRKKIRLVKGNHEGYLDPQDPINSKKKLDQAIGVLEQAGVEVQQGTVCVVGDDEKRIGVAGISGESGGWGDIEELRIGTERDQRRYRSIQEELTDLEIAFVEAERLFNAGEITEVVLYQHFALTQSTLRRLDGRGEDQNIWASLGCGAFERKVDCWRSRIPLVQALHGHAHYGYEEGQTEGGLLVRNVTVSVLHGHIKDQPLPPFDPAKMFATYSW